MKNYFITHNTHQYLFMTMIKLNLILKCSILILKFSNCGDYGPKLYIGPWALSEDTNKSEETNIT